MNFTGGWLKRKARIITYDIFQLLSKKDQAKPNQTRPDNSISIKNKQGKSCLNPGDFFFQFIGGWGNMKAQINMFDIFLFTLAKGPS